MTTRIEGILLAAGESRRMGYPKPLLTIGRETFLEHITAMMVKVVPHLVVVLGAYADRISQAIPADPRITIIENPDYPRGQLSSLKAGLCSISAMAGAALIHLADHPLVRPATFRHLTEHFEPANLPILIARSAGRRGHPVIFARSMFEELLAASDEAGARAVVNADPSRVGYIDVDDPGVGLDLDTPRDLESAGLPAPPAAG